MLQEILGVPGMNRGLAATRINEALQKIQNENVWSFQLQTSGWLTPSLLGGLTSTFLSPGTITVVPFTNTIIGDAVATQAWNAAIFNPPLLTQQQIRVPYYSLYSIIALGQAPTVAYLTIASPGFAQTQGTYLVNATSGAGNPGSGAQVLITVNLDGTVTIPPVVVNPGQGYNQPPIFTLAAGGVPATFSVTLNGKITIDRPWMEPAQLNSSYMVYQAYYAAPPGFKRFYAIRDTTNNLQMDFWSKTQIDLASEDAERTIFDQPYWVVPYQIDTRPGSATYGQFLYELWPHPITVLPYTFTCQCNFPALVNPNDNVPFPLTEEIVKQRTYEMVALWKESQKGDNMERGSGANWQFLAKAHHEEYVELLKEIRIMDRHLADTYFTKVNMQPPYGGEPYSTVNGQLNVGW